MGTLSLEEFEKCARDFVVHSDQINDFWQLKQPSQSPDNLHVYLVKKILLTVEPGGVKPSDEGEVDLLLLPDDDKMSLGHLNPSLVYTFEYHVIYSLSYGVPVLYFNVFKPDGSLLSLDHIWKLVPNLFSTRLEDKWTFITQQDHPLECRPFFHLHPCHTSQMMENITFQWNKENKTNGNYLVTWLSTVGPVLRLTLPLSYATLNASHH